MNAPLRTLQLVAAVVAALTALVLIIDADGTWIMALPFAAIAVTWATLPQLPDAASESAARRRDLVIRTSLFVSIAVCVLLMVIVLNA